MIYQLSWTTLPGLRGLSCSEFRATQTAAPDNERGVAVESLERCRARRILAELEAQFAARSDFSNNAAAFEAREDLHRDATARRASA